MPLVSIIIPVYNGERYIEEALASVFAQTFRDFEVIVVNDGSTDSTEERLRRHRNRIVYVLQPNRGQSLARKAGLEVARGSLIAFLDCDDVWLPEKLERQVGAARAYEQCGIITTDVERFDEHGVTLRSLKEWHSPASGFVMEKLLFDNFIPPSAAVVRRECFDRVTTFDVPPPCFGEDWLMWMQIVPRYPVYFIDEVLTRHREHSDSMNIHEGRELQFRCMLRNLEIMQQVIPELRERPDLIRKAGCKWSFHLGVRDVEALDLAHAREKLRRAVRFRPASLPAWVALAATYAPLWGLRSMKTALKYSKRLVQNSALLAGRRVTRA
jgi:hypothetical protein